VDFPASLEPWIRLGVFVGALAALAGLEVLAPQRRQVIGRWRRWPGNLGLVALDTLILRILFPAAAVGMALLAEKRGWGLLGVVDLPAWVEIAIAILLLDLIIYAQHVLFHAVPALWRVHRVHHADLECDVTTGLRFHPIEIVASMGIKFAAVAALGAPAVAVLIFEVVLNATAMWSHANIRLPERVDRVVRRVLVTPDMHRTHHSAVTCETHSNFGFNLAWWDRLFGTYRAQPAAGHDGMTIGVPQFRDLGELRFDRLLLQPLRRGASGERR
jgi:sterol desaturase/sphingolipid hydroxylase (fatty acid hydroxylase superfamily)